MFGELFVTCIMPLVQYYSVAAILQGSCVQLLCRLKKLTDSAFTVGMF